eukprot:4965909-Alexandrium_andersonii.AAC.1
MGRAIARQNTSVPERSAGPTPRPPLQTTLHRWGVWHGDTNAYDARRIRQYQDHVAGGGAIAAHPAGD